MIGDGTLESVRAALAAEVQPASTDDVVLVRDAPARRRSSLYFLGLAGTTECRWVAKRPHSDLQQQDLRSPLSAAGQFAALRRLHAHLDSGDGTVAAPRPVGYVPETETLVMEYVPGPTLSSLLTVRAVVHPRPALDGVRAAAQVLHAVHALEPAGSDRIDLAALDQRARRRGRTVLEESGLVVRESWFRRTPGAAGFSTARIVVLHGDFAPENVLLAPCGLYCLDPDLSVRGWAEHDVVRFLVMLLDAPVFVTGVDCPPVQILRRRATEAFLTAYYGSARRPTTLRPLVIQGVAERWAMRHSDLARRQPRLERTRRLLLRRYFTAVLDEVSAPQWPSQSR